MLDFSGLSQSQKSLTRITPIERIARIFNRFIREIRPIRKIRVNFLKVRHACANLSSDLENTILDFLNPVIIMDGDHQTMTITIDGTRIRAALRGFLELLESTDKHANVELLELWLGQLAFIQHFIGDLQYEDRKFSPPPVRDHARWRKLITEQFSALGYYSVPDAIPLQIAASGISVGDAVDNLAEIAGEIAECVWRWENNGENDALWYLRFSYQSRWGTHLRNLQAYIQNLPVKDRNKPARR